MATNGGDPELLARCMEELAATVLDAGDPMTYRTLGTSAHASADVSREALRAFADENASSVSALEVVVQRGAGVAAAGDNSTAKIEAVDPRARVIRIGAVSPAATNDDIDAADVLSRQIYCVYKKRTDDTSKSDVAPIATACWLQEHSLRNDIFQKVERHAPLSRAARAFFASGIACAAATTRLGFGDFQGEESVSVFDAVTAAKKPVAAIASTKSFFKASGSAAAPKPKPTAANATTPAKQQQQREIKTIDATSMRNVFTIDSDDDDDDSDDECDAPKFVTKKSGVSVKARSKRVISDDDDDDDGNDAIATTPAPAARTIKSSATSSSLRNVKRKLSASPDEKAPTKAATRPDDDVVDDDDEPAAVATTRRVEVTKTRINEQGYMVTEKTYEEVELTAEDIENERVAAAKKKKAAAAARAAADAKAAAAEKKAKSSGAGASGPAKQKNLFAFFNRK